MAVIYKCGGFEIKNSLGEPRCTYEAPAPWIGNCPGCGRWYDPRKFGTEIEKDAKTSILATDGKDDEVKRIDSGFARVNKVLSGGLPEQSFIVCAGCPGAGKTTLFMEILNNVAERFTCGYASSEQTSKHLRGEARRIGVSRDFHVFGTDSLGGDVLGVLREAEARKIKLLVFDSLQHSYMSYFEAEPGSTAQCGAVMRYLRDYCQRHKICLIITSQITGSGYVKGGEGVVHDADIQMSLFGSTKTGEICPIEESDLRVLGVGKTRFGQAGVKEIFRMTPMGLVEVDPEELVPRHGRTYRRRGEPRSVPMEGEEEE